MSAKKIIEKKEFDISELEIFDKSGRSINGNKMYADKDIFSIRKFHISFHKNVVNKIFNTNSGEVDIVFAKKGDSYFFAVVPFDSKINGYKVNIQTGLYAQCTSFAAKRIGLEEGIYEIVDCYFSGGIDWFEIEKIED